MKKSLIVLSTLAVMACASSSVFAGEDASSVDVKGGTIKFVGSVTDAPCAISMDQKDHIVIMRQVRTVHLDTAGKESGQPTPFTVDLQDCDTTTYKNASITFIGNPDSTVATAMMNEAVDSPATNVAIQLYGPDGAKLNVNSASSTYTLMDGTNKIPFKVDYVATAGQATAGSVMATATMQITYS